MSRRKSIGVRRHKKKKNREGKMAVEKAMRIRGMRERLRVESSPMAYGIKEASKTKEADLL